MAFSEVRGGAAGEYDYSIAKGFVISTLVWGAVGMLVGVWIAFALVFPSLNAGVPWLTFNRLRPLHTNGVVFGFVLSGVFAVWYYISQRLLKVRLVHKKIAVLHLVLYNLIIVLAAVSLPLGVTSSKEYAELQWPIDVLVVVMWLLWGFNIFSMCAARREKTMYVSIWYFVACFLGVGMLYLFNNAAIPVAFTSGLGDWFYAVSIYSGTNDANVQWWWGHNAVAFVLTVPIVGMSYYAIPKASQQPIFSYKLSLWSFWGLIFVYLWAGPHHLLYSTLPDWIQTLGMVFSISLIIPSWGSMVNLLMTVSGKWEQLKTDPVLKFLVIGSTFYGLATLEGPIQAIKSVNAVAHFTDWIVGHVHSGALGWVGFTIIGILYLIVPPMWKTRLHSVKLAEVQFWIQTLGIVFYTVSLWIAGITQGLMWRTSDRFGNLAYSFLDTVIALKPFWILRGIGGGLYLLGFLIFFYNILQTARRGMRQARSRNATGEALPKAAEPGFV